MIPCFLSFYAHNLLYKEGMHRYTTHPFALKLYTNITQNGYLPFIAPEMSAFNTNVSETTLFLRSNIPKSK